MNLFIMQHLEDRIVKKAEKNLDPNTLFPGASLILFYLIPANAPNRCYPLKHWLYFSPNLQSHLSHQKVSASTDSSCFAGC